MRKKKSLDLSWLENAKKSLAVVKAYQPGAEAAGYARAALERLSAECERFLSGGAK